MSNTLSTFALSMAMLCAVACAAEPAVHTWDFAGGLAGWAPRAATVTLESVPTVSAPRAPDTKGSLHIHGSMTSNWNYAVSDTRPMQAGQLYRVSAWLRVDKLGIGTPSPYLKCEFVATEKNRDLGRINTTVYDPAKLGEWQQLTVEFRAPEGIARCWIALEKGTERSAEVDAYLAAVKLETIARFTLFDKYVLNPLPEPLAAKKGIHPRLYLDAARVAALRTAV